MQRTLLWIGAVVLLVQFASGRSAAQVVVGPGFVRTPYSSVDWFPNGGAHIQSPYVNIFTPGPPPFPFYRENVQVPANECTQMNWQELSQAIWKWSGQLDFDLERLPNGEAWQTKLNTAAIAGLISTTVDAPPSEESRALLQDIFEGQQAAVDSFPGRYIARLASFENLQAALAEYVTPPEERLRRQLYTAANDLNTSLKRFTTAKNWQEFLTLSPGMTLSSGHAEDVAPVPDSAELSKALARFDTVEQNPEYKKISSVPAFKATRARLVAYLEQQPIATDQPATSGANPAPEELPAPLPSTR